MLLIVVILFDGEKGITSILRVMNVSQEGGFSKDKDRARNNFLFLREAEYWIKMIIFYATTDHYFEHDPNCIFSSKLRSACARWLI
jgi:hypothetical protein